MRRFSLALAVLGLIVAASPVLAQMPDPVITSARQFAQQGNHDTAIAMLRSAMATRPNDAALKTELLAVLSLKEAALRKQLDDLSREIALLRGAGLRAGTWTYRPTGLATPIRIGGAIKPPIKRRDVRPVYPGDAMAGAVQGVVIAEVTIDTEGKVSNARILRGVPLLDQAALDAVRQWEYEPTLLNGVPVPVIMTVTVTFSLR